jgi:Protein of unknown function (DUF1203)
LATLWVSWGKLKFCHDIPCFPNAHDPGRLVCRVAHTVHQPLQRQNTMTFQIHALPYAPFGHLFALPDDALQSRGIRRIFADADPGFPCRVSLQDAAQGEELLLLNYAHLQGTTPYAASHAIYVRKGAAQAQPLPDTVPEVLARRFLSVRAFDAHNLMVTADVTNGTSLAALLDDLFATSEVDFVHVHNAKQGCFAARATRG